MIQWIWLFVIFEAVTSLRMITLDLPRLVTTGQDAILNCVFELEGDTLYSIKWYRDDLEFFRFIPSDRPPNQYFPLQGLDMDITRSSNETIYLINVDETTTGTFKCEISADAPSFQTISAERSLKVEGIESRYHLKLKKGGSSRATSEKNLIFGVIFFFSLYCTLSS